jgi:hypothetical protein
MISTLCVPYKSFRRECIVADILRYSHVLAPTDPTWALKGAECALINITDRNTSLRDQAITTILNHAEAGFAISHTVAFEAVRTAEIFAPRDSILRQQATKTNMRLKRLLLPSFIAFATGCLTYAIGSIL